jgi:hypothetical protein
VKLLTIHVSTLKWTRQKLNEIVPGDAIERAAKKRRIAGS